MPTMVRNTGGQSGTSGIATYVQPIVTSGGTLVTYQWNLPKGAEIFSDDDIIVNNGSYEVIPNGIKATAAGSISVSITKLYHLTVYLKNTLLYANFDFNVGMALSGPDSPPLDSTGSNTNKAVMFKGTIHLPHIYESNSGYGTGHYVFNGKIFTRISTNPMGGANTSLTGGCAHGNYLYSMGTSNRTAYFHIYRFDGNTWTEVYSANLNIAPLYGTKMISCGNDIYMMGIEKNTSTRGMYLYDGAGAITKISDSLPFNVDSASGIYFNGKLHVTQGTSHYLLNGNTWTYVCVLPKSFASGVSLAVYNGKIVADGYAFLGNDWVEWPCGYFGWAMCLVPYRNKLYRFKLNYTIKADNVSADSELFCGYLKRGSIVNGNKAAADGVQTIQVSPPYLVG